FFLLFLYLPHKIYTMNFNPTHSYLVKSNVVVWFYVFLTFLFNFLVFVISLILGIVIWRHVYEDFNEDYVFVWYDCQSTSRRITIYHSTLALDQCMLWALLLSSDSFFLIFCRFPLVETF
ncbi:hypothetical protein PanWU01x14_363400, partial [Parasponia andersonii]